MKFGIQNRLVTKPSELGWALMFMGLGARSTEGEAARPKDRGKLARRLADD
jgi:hypothetical protein